MEFCLSCKITVRIWKSQIYFIGSSPKYMTTKGSKDVTKSHKEKSPDIQILVRLREVLRMPAI